MTGSGNANQRPAWREPMVWLVAAIPAMSIVAGVGLLIVAIRAGGADAIAEPVRRTAQVQVADLSPDARAAALRLRAVIRADSHGVEIIPVAGEFDGNLRLSLKLRHPIEARSDRVLELRPTKNGWRSDTSLANRHDWLLELSPSDGNWRLQGRWLAHQQAVVLLPAVEAPR